MMSNTHTVELALRTKNTAGRLRDHLTHTTGTSVEKSLREISGFSVRNGNVHLNCDKLIQNFTYVIFYSYLLHY